MKSSLIKKAAIGSIIYSIAATGIILYLSAGKVVTISDVAQDEVQKTETAGEGKSDTHLLTFAIGESNTSYLRIPLPKECKAEDIVIENHYMDQELCVLIANHDENFYEENVISGNWEMVEQGNYEVSEDRIKLNFQLSGIFEYRTILENNDLYISFLSPREMYDRIIVIDPACGGLNTGYEAGGLMEKNINLQITKMLKEKLDETDIKAYYTRIDDVNPKEEDRVRLANGTKADMYIRIQVNSDEDSSVYGLLSVYNGNYFIPGFGSVELADILEREVTTSVKGRALGLSEAEAQDYALRHITIPAAAIRVGCITNEQEAKLLGREEYCDRIATGIYNAIMKVYEEDL